jgi:hypothetical protein
MKRLMMGVAIAALVMGSVSVPAVASEKKAKVPVLAVCLGTVADAGSLGTFQNRPVARPPALIVDCPDGGDDDPRGISSDTVLTGVTWTNWGRKGARGTGTLNVPSMQCGYSSPQDGTPDQVQAMCSTCGEVCNTKITTPYPVSVVVSKPVRLRKKQQTFTTIAVTFTGTGPDGKTSQTYTPPRRASE